MRLKATRPSSLENEKMAITPGWVEIAVGAGKGKGGVVLLLGDRAKRAAKDAAEWLTVFTTHVVAGLIDGGGE